LLGNVAKRQPSATAPNGLSQPIAIRSTDRDDELLILRKSNAALQLSRWNYLTDHDDTLAHVDTDETIKSAQFVGDQAIAIRWDDSDQTFELRDTKQLKVLESVKSTPIGRAVVSPNGNYLAQVYGNGERRRTRFYDLGMLLEKTPPSPALPLTRNRITVEGGVLCMNPEGDALQESKQRLILSKRMHPVGATPHETGEAFAQEATHLKTFEGRWTAAFRNREIVAAEVLMEPRLHVRLHHSIHASRDSSLRPSHLFPVTFSKRSNPYDRAEFSSDGRCLVFDRRTFKPD
jgi:hypothetical protein